MQCLLVGGGGPVGVSFLYLAKKLGWKVWVVDPVVPKNIKVHRKLLRGSLMGWTKRKYELKDFRAHLSRGQFNVAVDLTPTMDKRKTIEICDSLGVTLINSTMVDYKDDIHIAAYNFLDNRPSAKRCGHIVATGMNPGAINAMAEEVIDRNGDADAIAYWEYDDTCPGDGRFRGPSITWCVGESAAEIGEDWNFEVVEEGTILLHEDALDWPAQNFRACGAPLDLLPIPPGSDAFLIGHEECVYMGWRHDVPVKFIYGFHAENMRLIREASYGFKPELLIRTPGDNLIGKDVIGVSVQYRDRWHGQYCILENGPEIPLDTNATCMLVASGVAASVLLVGKTKMRPGVYLTHELKGYMSAFRSLVRVHDYVVDEGKSSIVSESRVRPPLVHTPNWNGLAASSCKYK